jgi:DsbC/DsbD-like thiol-disulfide interchange protein
LAPVTLAAGGKGTVALEMTLGPGWHVNSHRPLQNFLIPTTATLATSGGTLSDIRYPEPVKKRFEFADEPLAVYQGTVRFESELALPVTATGKVNLGGVLAYQPCNDSQCFPPAKTILSATVDVAGAQAKGK